MREGYVGQAGFRSLSARAERESPDVRHATSETLREIEPLLETLRSVPGLVEKRPGIFYRKSKAFLHFHEDPSGLHADVRFGEEFERVRVASEVERKALMARIRAV
jgi:hypothetical protein